MTEKSQDAAPPQLVLAASTALQNALLQGSTVPRPELDGSGPRSVLLDELARIATLVAAVAQTSTQSRDLDVERSAAELSTALIALRKRVSGH